MPPTIPVLKLEPAASAQDGEAPTVQVLKKRKPVTILSPLRYPGSKRRFAVYIERALHLNGVQPELFVEPFAGGASVSLQLLADDVVETIGLADRDPLVAAFWKTVFFDSDWLIQQVQDIEVTLAQWETFKTGRLTTTREQALACLFLNRTSFSGIIAPGAGPIGGKAQESAYKIDCRFPRRTLEKRIRQAAALKHRVSFVWNLSWRRALPLIASCQERGTLPMGICYYFDPPFFEKADGLYTHFFTAKNHRHFRNAVLALNDPWILSYDPAPAVHELYGDAEVGNARVELLYSTAGSTDDRRSAQEVIISNLPRLPDHCRLWQRDKGKIPSLAAQVDAQGQGVGAADAVLLTRTDELALIA